mmetsp:Transcript_51685/g.107500  ORF Transcript_51685/g.107500 Transcript_51685/m.107500 type:complete len:286 (-) Transcript_51685:765-1622(-)
MHESTDPSRPSSGPAAALARRAALAGRQGCLGAAVRRSQFAPAPRKTAARPAAVWALPTAAWAAAQGSARTPRFRAGSARYPGSRAVRRVPNPLLLPRCPRRCHRPGCPPPRQSLPCRPPARNRAPSEKPAAAAPNPVATSLAPLRPRKPSRSRRASARVHGPGVAGGGLGKCSRCPKRSRCPGAAPPGPGPPYQLAAFARAPSLLQGEGRWKAGRGSARWCCFQGSRSWTPALYCSLSSLLPGNPADIRLAFWPALERPVRRRRYGFWVALGSKETGPARSARP